MNSQTLTVRSAPHPKLRYVVAEDGQTLNIPPGWACLKPGDAAVTRTLKTLGPSWTAVRKKGRKTFSDGVWAPAENIEQAKAIVAEKRAEPGYEKRRAADLKRREKKQNEYEASFRDAVFAWLNFHPRHRELADRLAEAVTRHAVPVGSGTVARTERISIDKRAEAAVIAWMRHQTTCYDTMTIERVKGRRREVRRALAGESIRLLRQYRDGESIDREHCPLTQALQQSPNQT